jgi:hypothetical protein
MLLASSPSRLKELRVDSFKNGTATVTWTASPEKGVNGYLVAYGTPAKPDDNRFVSSNLRHVTGIAPGTIRVGESDQHERARRVGLGTA